MLKNRAEKNLFITIWAVILVGTAVWFFLPRERPLIPRAQPALKLSPELASILTAAVTHAGETRFEISYSPTAEYRGKLGREDKDLVVQYEYRNDSRTIGAGIATLHLVAAGDRTVLPNEDRRVPSTIYLSLPR